MNERKMSKRRLILLLISWLSRMQMESSHAVRSVSRQVPMLLYIIEPVRTAVSRALAPSSSETGPCVDGKTLGKDVYMDSNLLAVKCSGRFCPGCSSRRCPDMLLRGALPFWLCCTLAGRLHHSWLTSAIELLANRCCRWIGKLGMSHLVVPKGRIQD